MATKTWTCSSGFANGDRKDGYTFTLTVSNGGDTPGATSSTHTIDSLYLNLTAIACYTTNAWLDVLDGNGNRIAYMKDYFSTIVSSGASNSNQTFELDGYANTFLDTGTTIKIKVRSKGNGNACNIRGGCAMTITANISAVAPPEPTYTNCGAPTSVTLSRNRGTVTINWSGATAGTNNAIASYTIIRNTSTAESGATTTHTGVTSGGQTNAPGTGTFYYGVKTVGSVSGYDSGYKWSSSITVPARPTVSQGDYITKAQMDTLRTFINTGCTEVTRYAKIDDAQGDTYSPAPENEKITAYWYNNA